MVVGGWGGGGGQEGSAFKTKILFLCKSKTCIQQLPSHLQSVATGKLGISLRQQGGSGDGTRVTKLLRELPRGGKIDSPGKTDLRVLQ